MHDPGAGNRTDFKVLNDLVVGGQDLIGPFVGRLSAMGAIQDLDDWSWPFPARFDIQIRQLAIPCGDTIQWGLRALQVRYSGVGAVSARFLAETLALMRWVATPASDEGRQERSLQILKRELERTEKLYVRATNKATGQIRDRLREKTKDISAAIEALSEIAKARGVKTLQDPPDRPRMLDEFLDREGGYGLFALTSEVAGHPGFMHLAPFASGEAGRFDVDLGGMIPHRLYWAVIQVELFARLVKTTADCLRWDDWFENSFLSVLDPLEDLRSEAWRIAQAVADPDLRT